MPHQQLRSAFAVALLSLAYLAGVALSYDRADSIRDGTEQLHETNYSAFTRAGLPVWPSNVVPYVISPGFSTQDLANIRIAIDDYHAKTCIRWIQRTTEPLYTSFIRNVSGLGCAYTTPDKTMMVYENCREAHTFIHEMGHVLGRPHEQNRLDRETYLNSAICPDGTVPWAEHLYDYLSVMHYPCDPGCPRLPGVPYCGQYYEGGRLSVLDADVINDLYGCGGCFSYRFRFSQLTAPSLAFRGGTDIFGGTTYVCRGYVNGNVYIGPASGDLHSCWLPGGGLEYGMSAGFEVLTNPTAAPLQWRQATGVIPPGAIATGRNSTHGTAYIGRCNLNVNGLVSVTPGTVMAGRPGEIRVPFAGLEYTCTNFEILTCG